MTRLPNLFVQTDLATASGVYSVADRIRREWGGLDVLVNNVGGTETKPGGFEVLSDEDWQETLELNLLAAVRLDRIFIPGMIERGSGSLSTSPRSPTVCHSPIRHWPTQRPREL